VHCVISLSSTYIHDLGSGPYVTSRCHVIIFCLLLYFLPVSAWTYSTCIGSYPMDLTFVLYVIM
jgi:hypothetical protein